MIFTSPTSMDPCDYDPSKCLMADGSKQCDACRELAELDDHIRRTAEPLEAKRRAIKEEINRFHDPLSRHHLPSELFARIFELYVEDDSNTAPFSLGLDSQFSKAECSRPLLISAVCRSWREVAFATPEIWATANIYLHDSVDTQTQEDLTRQWLDRSGQLPLKLSILHDDSISIPGPPNLQFVNVIRGYTQRWQDVTLIISSSLLSAVAQDLISAPLLRRLMLWPNSMGETDPFYLLDSLVLEELQLNNVFIRDFHLHWNNITIFRMNVVSVDEVFEVLRRADKLEKCILSDISLPVDEDFPLPKRPLIHHSLKELQVEDLYITYHKLFDLLVLPSLTRLSLLAHYDFLGSSLISLCSRSQWALETFVLGAPLEGITDAELIQVLEYMPSLTHLSLSHISHYGDELTAATWMTDEFFKQFQADKAAIDFLPHLKDFEISGSRSFSWNILLEMLNSFRLRSHVRTNDSAANLPCTGCISRWAILATDGEFRIRLNLSSPHPSFNYIDKDVLEHLASPDWARLISLQIMNEFDKLDLIKASAIHHNLALDKDVTNLRDSTTQIDID